MGPVAVLALSLAVLFTCWLAAASGASTALLLAPLPPANFSGFAALFATPLELLARAAAPLALAPALAAAPAAEWVAWLKALPAAAYAWASGTCCARLAVLCMLSARLTLCARQLPLSRLTAPLTPTPTHPTPRRRRL